MADMTSFRPHNTRASLRLEPTRSAASNNLSREMPRATHVSKNALIFATVLEFLKKKKSEIFFFFFEKRANSNCGDSLGASLQAPDECFFSGLLERLRCRFWNDGPSTEFGGYFEQQHSVASDEVSQQVATRAAQGRTERSEPSNELIHLFLFFF